jgi:hypothetical protein
VRKNPRGQPQGVSVKYTSHLGGISTVRQALKERVWRFGAHGNFMKAA